VLLGCYCTPVAILLPPLSSSPGGAWVLGFLPRWEFLGVPLRGTFPLMHHGREEQVVSPSDIRTLRTPVSRWTGCLTRTAPARHGIARRACITVGMPPPPCPTHAQHTTARKPHGHAGPRHSPSHLSQVRDRAAPHAQPNLITHV
jgi:hypothetical protein